jgi:hypothetical protein
MVHLIGCADGDAGRPTSPFANPGSASNTAGMSGGSTTNDAQESSGGADSTGKSEETGAATSGPASCGDGVAQEGESCDGKDLGGMSCADFGFSEGNLVCDAQCNLLTDGCRSCGDGMLAASELCDGTNVGSETCQSQGFGGGTLLCDADCVSFDTSQCTPLPTCGDGVRNGGEACDGNDLGGATCASVGFDQGNLGCTAACTHDTSACEFLDCGSNGDFCLLDENDPQGTCCPAGVGGNVLGICVLIMCQ